MFNTSNVQRFHFRNFTAAAKGGLSCILFWKSDGCPEFLWNSVMQTPCHGHELMNILLLFLYSQVTGMTAWGIQYLADLCTSNSWPCISIYCSSCIHNLTHGHEPWGIQCFADLCTLNFVRFKGVVRAVLGGNGYLFECQIFGHFSSIMNK